MPQIIFLDQAAQDLVRLFAFLEPQSPEAGLRAVRKILEGIRQLSRHPRVGRVAVFNVDEYRELIVPWGGQLT